MKATLTFEKKIFRVGIPEQEATVPDLIGGLILQNNLEFHLEEEDEIYEGYGRRRNSFPYRQFSCYSRQLEEKELETAVLENDYLKAVFLPSLGGRLWSLWDKTADKNLLYTNDVIRCSNLAVRNAWFSGGVEFNIGVIGHFPFTTSQLFTAVAEEKGLPVLRMYEYERIRGVVWQMDFWLGEEDRFLNARMRIVNESDQVVPMYWWSNIAVPEHENGRIVVPAQEAFSFRGSGVCKVEIPMVDGNDITRYQNIPSSVDYFFSLYPNRPKYIAHVDGSGYGLLHMSTDRLQSRKLFSWGHKRGSDRWQGFLTENGGRYVEIQAGLGKTQYGCLPMAPHTAWEWMERYGAVQLSEEERDLSFEALRNHLTDQIAQSEAYLEMAPLLGGTKEMAKRPGVLHTVGSGYGALERSCRETALSEHLDFGTMTAKQRGWQDFWRTGIFPIRDAACPPVSFMDGQVWYERMKRCEPENKNNWYFYYHLGLFLFMREEYEAAAISFERSERLCENPWACHGAGSALLVLGRQKEAAKAFERGILLRTEDLSYVKESLRLLELAGGHQETAELYGQLVPEIRQDRRVQLFYVRALLENGHAEEAYDLLMADGGVVPEDVREGERSIAQLWRDLTRCLWGEEKPLPKQFDFQAS